MSSLTSILDITTLIDLALIFGGLVWLWKDYASPAARARDPNAGPLAAWEITTHGFVFALIRVLGTALLVQIFTVQVVQAFAPGFDFTKGFGIVLGGGAFQFGMLLGVGVARFFMQPVIVAPWEIDERPVRPPAAKGFGVVREGFCTFLVATAVVIILSFSWQYLLEKVGINGGEQELLSLLRNSHSALEHGSMLVLAVVVAPISEELIFRAGLFRYLRTRTYRWLALVAPAALFAGLHYNITAFPALLALGLIFSLAYERTGSIWVTIIAHGLFNLHTFVMVYLAPKV